MNKRLILPLILSFFLILSLVAFFFFSNQAEACNDGTLLDECSEIKPYFCSYGKLIENASFCGCSNLSNISGESCNSNLRTEPKEINFTYVLRGETGTIPFTVYKGADNYFYNIPRYIDSSENPSLLDFKLKVVNDEQQKELLLPLVVKIQEITSDKTDQARIAISLVQFIPFGTSDKVSRIGNIEIDYQRYPYEVLYDYEGICSEKSELLTFLLKELGYDTAILYYSLENHDAVGIKCSDENSLKNTGYCFVETTGPSIITDDQTEYIGEYDSLSSVPKILNISHGIFLGENLYEYKDAQTLIDIRKDMQDYGVINFLQHFQYQALKKKYGLSASNSS